ncbi:MAG TPA: ABC transporter ATP-binding protein [Thermococcus sp.]|uniref:ABC transporter ATP-binding protein n=1 Tax=Thermococcus sp. TaxID=35749 RepID=UPI000F191E7C|nr:ABC transporter ATP-binding protein [Thermococcus sp.]RLF78360.1 MAG: ABC transporter ATP-binding protein [Thermococci archaeon]MCD6140310.1 ABC transporter ATP-binding protein [Thermococcus sp.]MCD6143430.1 ABC transporter ATP-binding protein [Thermococcus sp.]RLF85412.1 MAG: ABC transporter ATP-binding protein [Thermococci archaeon]RLF86658.1 MAG: ABC transporter ATP-binding protein [Thermococci archaeon]
MEHVIETKDLTKFFGKRNIIYHLNLKVPKGVVYGFLGPNGAGKTTTIKMLTAALRPTYGEIRIFGLEMPQKRVEIMKNVGYMPEVPIAYEDMTIVEFLTYIGRLSGLKKEEAIKQTKELMRYVGVGRLALNKIKELSSGQKQRVAFASALIADPELLILDEPTANLDPLGRIEFIGKIISLAKEGKTIFVSSHIVSEVEKMCNYVGLINQGRLIAQGRVSELTQIEETEYDIITSDNGKACEFLREKPYVREIWEEEGTIRVQVDPRFLDEFFLQFPKYLTSQGIRLKLFRPHTSPLERILMEKFNIGEESD